MGIPTKSNRAVHSSLTVKLRQQEEEEAWLSHGGEDQGWRCPSKKEGMRGKQWLACPLGSSAGDWTGGLMKGRHAPAQPFKMQYKRKTSLESMASSSGLSRMKWGRTPVKSQRLEPWIQMEGMQGGEKEWKVRSRGPGRGPSIWRWKEEDTASRVCATEQCLQGECGERALLLWQESDQEKGRRAWIPLTLLLPYSKSFSAN